MATASGSSGTAPAAAASAATGAHLSRSPSERLLAACRDYTAAYQELQEKYHDLIYSTAEKLVRTSQAAQQKLLKTHLEKETSDVMRQLNVARRTEVKALAVRHKDRDELVRYVQGKGSEWTKTDTARFSPPKYNQHEARGGFLAGRARRKRTRKTDKDVRDEA